MLLLFFCVTDVITYLIHRNHMPTKLHFEAKIKIEVACAITNFKENGSLNPVLIWKHVLIFLFASSLPRYRFPVGFLMPVHGLSYAWAERLVFHKAPGYYEFLQLIFKSSGINSKYIHIWSKLSGLCTFSSKFLSLTGEDFILEKLEMNKLTRKIISSSIELVGWEHGSQNCFSFTLDIIIHYL